MPSVSEQIVALKAEVEEIKAKLGMMTAPVEPASNDSGESDSGE